MLSFFVYNLFDLLFGECWEIELIFNVIVLGMQCYLIEVIVEGGYIVELC